ncbi:MAG: hypothetical protein WD078_04135 [Woeseia sp.]
MMSLPNNNAVAGPYGLGRFRRALGHFIGGRAVQALARAALVLLLVRILPVEDYGAYMLVVGLSEAALQLFSFGIVPVGYRFLPELVTSGDRSAQRRFIAVIAGIQLCVLSVAVFVLHANWENLVTHLGIGPEQAAATVAGVLLFLLVPAFRLGVDLLDALLEQGRAQTARAIMPGGRVAVLASFMLLQGEILTLGEVILVDVGVTAFCLVLTWFFLFRSIVSRPGTRAETRLPVRAMLRFAWHMAAVDLLAATASPGAIRAAVGASLGVAGAALFAFLQSLQRLAGRYLPGVLLRGLVRPVLFARSLRPQGMQTVQSGSALLLKLNLAVAMAGCVLIAAGGDGLVAVLSGGKFTEAGDTLLLLFLGLASVSQRSVVEMMMQIGGQTNALRWTAGFAPLALLGVWQFGYLGLNVAIGIMIAGSVLSNGVAMLIIRRGSPLSIDFAGLTAIGAAGLIGIGAALVGRETGYPFAAAAAAIAVFAAAMITLRPFTATETELVGKVAGRRSGRLLSVAARGSYHREDIHDTTTATAGGSRSDKL